GLVSGPLQVGVVGVEPADVAHADGVQDAGGVGRTGAVRVAALDVDHGVGEGRDRVDLVADVVLPLGQGPAAGHAARGTDRVELEQHHGRPVRDPLHHLVDLALERGAVGDDLAARLAVAGL